MATSRNCTTNGLIVTVTVALVFSTFLPPNTAVLGLAFTSHSQSLQQRKMVLGSKPPGCVNKCLSCRPCMATLVVPSHQRKRFTFKTSSSHGGDDDDNYYLLSWKCRCGDKLFQP